MEDFMADPRTQDIDDLMAIFNSPSLSRYIQQAKSFEVSAAADPSSCAPSTSAELPSSSQYQTRARTSMPFSPPRRSVTHGGHTYHLSDQYVQQGNIETVASADFDAPIVHIPDEPCSPGVSIADDSQDDGGLYEHFLEELTKGTSETGRPVDDRRDDPTYQAPRKKTALEEENYPISVSACEIKRLLADLQTNPIPGLSSYMPFTEEPYIVTRSVTRSKPMEGYIEPANLAPSPIKNRHCCPPPLTRSKIRRSEENLAECDHVASRTRGHLANSPRKSCLTEEFKKPLPVSEYHPRKDHPTGGSRDISHTSADPWGASLKSPISSGRRRPYPAVCYERYKPFGLKLSKFLAKPNFPSDLKEMVAQMFDMIIQREDRRSKEHERQNVENGIGKPVDEVKDATLLLDCTLRLVNLITGNQVVSQVLPVFNEALEIDKELMFLIFGLLVHDESPYVLELAPMLYGKTRLLKSLRGELLLSKDPLYSKKSISIVQKVLETVQCPSSLNDMDLDDPTVVRLGISGSEGTLCPSVYAEMELDSVVNMEESFRELTLAKRERDEAAATETAAKMILPQSTAERVSQSNEGVSDNSNSSLFLPNTPGTPGQCHQADDLLHSHYLPHNVGGGVCDSQQLLTSTNVPFSAPYMPDWISEPKKPLRRIPLFSGPLTGSPLKNPLFESPSRKLKYSLRSCGAPAHDSQ